MGTGEQTDMSSHRGTIGILTGGGDAQGLNQVIATLTVKAIEDGYRVVGIRRGWDGLINLVPDNDADNSRNFQNLTVEIKKIARTGGTFLHTSRVQPDKLPAAKVPDHLKSIYSGEINDLTPEILKNLEFLKLDCLIVIGGDDTLRFATRLHDEGVNTVAIPITIENDVPGTDYCIGFSTCCTRIIELTNNLRTIAGSHEALLVVEVPGQYAGFTALYPAMAGVVDRCVIPEYPFSMEKLTELLVGDRNKNPSKYSIVLVSQGASMIDETGHPQTADSIGKKVSLYLQELSSRYNNGTEIPVFYQDLGNLIRSGNPDSHDSMFSMAFGTISYELIGWKKFGRMASFKDGKYTSTPIHEVLGEKRKVGKKHYIIDELKPSFINFFGEIPLTDFELLS
jgi:6-phosphofructokinase